MFTPKRPFIKDVTIFDPLSMHDVIYEWSLMTLQLWQFPFQGVVTTGPCPVTGAPVPVQSLANLSRPWSSSRSWRRTPTEAAVWRRRVAEISTGLQPRLQTLVNLPRNSFRNCSRHEIYLKPKLYTRHETRAFYLKIGHLKHGRGIWRRLGNFNMGQIWKIQTLLQQPSD